MPEIDELTIADEPASWAALGFAVEGETCRIGRVALRLAGRAAGRGIVRWTLRDATTTELDGLPTALAGATTAPLAERAPVHPNGVTRIDHVVAVSPALDRTVTALEAAGLDLRRVREEPTPAGAPRQAFFRLGAEILEAVQEPADVVERAGGAERPASFWGLALCCEDIDATVARLGEHVSEVRDAVQPGRRIASLRRSAGLGLPVALMTA
ncbi:VOC family protein [Conexibacter woesei]|uniref:Glyoxalase/bleomycin resistance protein/dioxygenase n=1 Tax=Conexibacter woesei (strain DSM 14684 / CCUG 47730 / CIP 108061 / JCM 11494 / NBRC 100937 / ID131577) TaxID=469383 RepID=D3FAE7_CONWI|nr:glyoxalase/bleomycin resistance protein/dioxygenase [Conexibacter woesei]ADB49216.1 Glyoxalase/bleomycin resistance protein/dioxygenase [Conexibacter woesei DSM 14684]